jgi:hypothetical protein
MSSFSTMTSEVEMCGRAPEGQEVSPGITKRGEDLQGSAGNWSFHLLERIADAPPVFGLTLIATLLAFNRALACDQLGFVSMIP